MTTVITRTMARVVAPIVLVVAASLFLEGHNLPGGGFIAGVLAVTAFALLYLAYDLDFLERIVLDRDVETGEPPYQHRFVGAYRRLFVVGLAIAVVWGLVPLAFDLPFLSQSYVELEGVPIYGHVEVASATAFDLGVLCVVVGGLLTIVSVVGAE